VQFRVDPVRASVTWELRQAVLRPHETIEQMALADDDDPSTGTFGAFNEDEAVVGTVRVAPDPPPFPVDTYGSSDSLSWRLRGMATREDLRNAGIGTAVLNRAVDHVADKGGGLLWCHARVPALNLYRRAGFVVHGDLWEEDDIGPHLVMWRWVAAAEPG
jgi:GNAT superfamily N-acetyltransferase